MLHSIVDNLSADLNLAATVAQLVTINAGVQVGITKVNLTVVDVDAQLELVVRLGKHRITDEVVMPKTDEDQATLWTL